MLQPKTRLESRLLLALAPALIQGCSAMWGPVPAVENVGVQSTLSAPVIELNTVPSVPAIPPAKTTTMPTPVRTGRASWYGPGFNGKKTASGDIFDDDKFTAAHKTLPLGTKA